MRLATLPLDEFECFSDGLARTRADWLVSIEEHTPDLGRGDLEIGLPVASRPFRRLAREEKGLIVEYLDSAGERVSYSIPHPLGVRQVLHDDPTVELRVEDSHGATTLICLRRSR